MRTFTIDERKNSPRIYLDEKKKLVEISGNSTLKETNWFYGNLLKWIIAFNLGNNPTQVVNIKLKRLNTGSTKWLPLIFNQVIRVFPNANFEINYYLENNNRELESFGNHLKNHSISKVNILMN